MSAIELPEAPAAQPDCRKLANGLRVAMLSRPAAGKAAISVRVAAGSHDEPEAYPGLAHFLEHLVFLGSAGFAVEQGLMAFVQGCGGQVNASTQARHTDYFCEVPADRLGEALVRLIDMLSKPLLAQSAQLREREVVHAEFLARAQDADTLVATALGQALPAAHRFAAFQAGNRQTLAVEDTAFQQALHSFHRRFYQAAQLSLVLVGPQSVEELFGLVQCVAGELPSQVRCTQALAAPLLPLRSQQLRMSLPTGEPSVQLCFALELPGRLAGAGLDQALDFLQLWIVSESAGGLLATLREAELCRGLQARVLYRFADQALLLLSFRHVDESAQSAAVIAAAVQDWLAFFTARADYAVLAERYRAIQGWRLQSLGPLALARYWQDGLAGGAPSPLGLTEEGQAAVRAVLAQLQEPWRSIRLVTGCTEVASWPTAGFALRMVAEAAVSAPQRDWTWQLPAGNPLLNDDLAPGAMLGHRAQLQWLPAPAAVPAQQGGGLAAFHGRCCFADGLPLTDLLRVAQADVRELQADAAQLGVRLQLSGQGDSLEFSLQGPANLLVGVLRLLWPRLLEPSLQALQQAEPGAAADDMPIRQLLWRLPEVFGGPVEKGPALSVSQLRAGYRQARVEGLGVGFSPAGQAALERMFVTLPTLAQSAAPAMPRAGRYWQDAALDCGESALLLFCPLAAADAASEAAWRLLAHLYQGAFFQRLRSELQLGYAVFCGFRQVRAQRGILFAVQSPHASAQEILGHIEVFLQVQGQRLASLSEAAVAAAAAEQGRQLREQASSTADFAEQQWQLHLAGLPESHAAALHRALAQCTRHDLLQQHHALGQAHGGWRVLANSRPPDNRWMTPS